MRRLLSFLFGGSRIVPAEPEAENPDLDWMHVSYRVKPTKEKMDLTRFMEMIPQVFGNGTLVDQIYMVPDPGPRRVSRPLTGGAVQAPTKPGETTV